jgi:hypothetical protein
MAMVADRPPVRTGTCSLTVEITGGSYRLSPGTPPAKGARVWRLRSLGGPRAGAVYSVVTHRRIVCCSCPDSMMNLSVCKHVRALQALGLVAKSAVPEAVQVYRNTHPREGLPAAPVAD